MSIPRSDPDLATIEPPLRSYLAYLLPSDQVEPALEETRGDIRHWRDYELETALVWARLAILSRTPLEVEAEARALLGPVGLAPERVADLVDLPMDQLPEPDPPPGDKLAAELRETLVREDWGPGGRSRRIALIAALPCLLLVAAFLTLI